MKKIIITALAIAGAIIFEIPVDAAKITAVKVGSKINVTIDGKFFTSYIFSDDEGKKYNENFISKQFKKALRKADLDDNLHMHNLRHSFCSNLVQKGVSLYVVKELAGHQQLSTTEIYSHLTHTNLSNAVAVL